MTAKSSLTFPFLGGTYSNMLGINLARFRKFPRVKNEGMASCGTIVLFTSEQSHYSIKKSACLLGIGLDNVITVECDDKGKMIPEDLEQKIMESKEKVSKKLKLFILNPLLSLYEN